jgi:hypothetical protein
MKLDSTSQASTHAGPTPRDSRESCHCDPLGATSTSSSAYRQDDPGSGAIRYPQAIRPGVVVRAYPNFSALGSDTRQRQPSLHELEHNFRVLGRITHNQLRIERVRLDLRSCVRQAAEMVLIDQQTAAASGWALAFVVSSFTPSATSCASWQIDLQHRKKATPPVDCALVRLPSSCWQPVEHQPWPLSEFARHPRPWQ